MSESLDTNDRNHAEPPIWSIAVAVIIILGAPLVLYSLAPTGPIREGDTVFSKGEQHVQIHQVSRDHPEKADDTCLLDPNSPLIVLSWSSSPSDDVLVAQVQGNPAAEWPFCPVHTEVLLSPHQIFQKPAVLGAIQEMLTGWFRR